jgi:hypothetical protein
MMDFVREYLTNCIRDRKKKWQATHIAPLNRLSLLYSYPGEFQQELVV